MIDDMFLHGVPSLRALSHAEIRQRIAALEAVECPPVWPCWAIAERTELRAELSRRRPTTAPPYESHWRPTWRRP